MDLPVTQGHESERWRYEIELVPQDETSDENFLGERSQVLCNNDDVQPDASCTELQGQHVICSTMLSRLREHVYPLPWDSVVEWTGGRTEPFLFGSFRIILIVHVEVREDCGGQDCGRKGESRVDSVAEGILAILSTYSDVLQSVSVLSRACVGKRQNDAFRTCLRLFVGASEAKKRWQAHNDRTTQHCVLGCTELQQLLQSGYTVIDRFILPSTAAGIARLAAASMERDEVVGSSSESSKSVFPHTAPDERPLKWRWPEPRTARSDCVAWVDAHVSKGELLSDLQAMLSCLLDLQTELGFYAEDDRLLGKREVQMACYAPGSSGYRKHTDAMPDDAAGGASGVQRKLTAVCYCNTNWLPEDGGALRITLQDHQGGGTVDIAPIAGRCVVFLSGCTPHEVLASHAHRYAITAWYW